MLTQINDPKNCTTVSQKQYTGMYSTENTNRILVLHFFVSFFFVVIVVVVEYFIVSVQSEVGISWKRWSTAVSSGSCCSSTWMMCRSDSMGGERGEVGGWLVRPAAAFVCAAKTYE